MMKKPLTISGFFISQKSAAFHAVTRAIGTLISDCMHGA